ncbi:MAG: pyruvate dehydrogenase (acetyl-transferring) E1 component subunit alpha [Anaerolineae bacterium]|nr:pyruvate dehydrogenase (acetyl-transferring) E1 component subunit alpha [Anaerolineae bacterium]NIN94415.1 pyruvate dehydrogenase (acetyl-transferring) E1 component subunit alpha [Anaerolineae bacterium]NIQ77481.1 pyruvate dehydrogenase (acetyl-transferring) E1 component subunit alpha [Anaerolineae bacterium]
MLRTMHTIRFFEQTVDDLFGRGLVHGTMHLSTGQEASAVGSIYALRDDDYILSTHRGHGHCIAKGADINLMMAEFMGKETGYCRGRGGSMHIADMEGRNLGANGVVGGGVPLAVGVGLALQMQGRDEIIMGFFGDGAANQGSFHEALNMAAIWSLPLVYVCENNQYGMSMSTKRAFNIERISQRADGYGMPGVTVDGNDVVEVYEAATEAVARARAGEGPTLLECVTYRWKGHSKSDQELYRTKQEIQAWKERDPIPRFRDLLLAGGVISQEEATFIEETARRIISEALEFAQASPEPSVDTILEGVYA